MSHVSSRLRCAHPLDLVILQLQDHLKCFCPFQVPELTRAAGYIASNSEQLIEAYNRLGGKGKIITVPCSSTDGKVSLLPDYSRTPVLHCTPFGLLRA